MRENLSNEYWERFAVTRPVSPKSIVSEFRELIDTNPKERDVQKFLEQNPWLLSEQFPHCHYILPQFSLAGQFIPDFIAPERCSGETLWMLIELEQPNAMLTTKDGFFSKTVRTAIGQVRDWKRWLLENQDLAKKSRLDGGLDLHDMSRLLCGYIIVGRTCKVNDRFNQLRSDLFSNEGIEIVTYDRVIDWAAERASFWEGYSSSFT